MLSRTLFYKTMNRNAQRRGKAKERAEGVEKYHEAVLRECGSLQVGRVSRHINPYNESPTWYAVFSIPEGPYTKADSVLVTGATKATVLRSLSTHMSVPIVNSLYSQVQQLKKEVSTPEILAAALFGEREVVDNDESRIVVQKPAPQPSAAQIQSTSTTRWQEDEVASDSD